MSLIRHWLLMVLPFALWGTAMAAMAPLVDSAGPLVVASLRLLPAGLVLLIAVPFLGRSWVIAPKDLLWFLMFTFIDASLFQLFLAKGLSETGAGLGSVIIDSQPLMVALLARSLFGDAINPIGWVGLMVGLLGILCLGAPPELLSQWFLMGQAASISSLWSHGEGWMFSAAIAMALGTVLIRFTCRNSDPVAVTGWHMIIGSAPLIACHFFDSKWSFLPDWSIFEWGLMAYASLFGSALAYGLFFWFANKEELTTFSTLAFLTPVFALASGGIWLGERLQLLQWVGVSLVLLSVVLVSQRRRFWHPSTSDANVLQGGARG
ncbi:DMT family transporter [Prochlorococcus sp. MIT 1307]|uniref:DMT family transporter n=1 Tax=Prochlorococcus sp. MIT 1307 TaxID=3096219 RepID=UPI002A755F08|nr:DMT family transporter [Prochlorococcus sp. MIT 1307]